MDVCQKSRQPNGKITMYLRVFTAVFLSGCSSISTDDQCVTDAPGLAKTLISNETLPSQQVVLSFYGDVYEDIEALGETLRSNGISSAFFLRGSSIESNEAEIKGLVSQGHLIANQGYSGNPLTSLSDPSSDVRLADALITPYIKNNSFLFKAPQNAFTTDIIDHLNQSGLSKYAGPIAFENDEGLDLACWEQGISVEDCSSTFITLIDNSDGAHIGLSLDHPNTADLAISIVASARIAGYSFVTIFGVPDIVVAATSNGATPTQDPPAETCDDYS